MCLKYVLLILTEKIIGQISQDFSFKQLHQMHLQNQLDLL